MGHHDFPLPTVSTYGIFFLYRSVKNIENCLLLTIRKLYKYFVLIIRLLIVFSNDLESRTITKLEYYYYFLLYSFYFNITTQYWTKINGNFINTYSIVIYLNIFFIIN